MCLISCVQDLAGNCCFHGTYASLSCAMCACSALKDFLNRAACMQAVANSFDGIIDTVSAQHDISQLLPLLKVDFQCDSSGAA